MLARGGCMATASAQPCETGIEFLGETARGGEAAVWTLSAARRLMLMLLWLLWSCAGAVLMLAQTLWTRAHELASSGVPRGRVRGRVNAAAGF